MFTKSSKTFMSLQKKHLFKKLTLGMSLLAALFVIPGCGKEEAAGGTVGAATGAAIGAAVASEKHKATAALIGGLVGNTIGRAIGANEDRRAEREEHLADLAEVQARVQENHDLRRSIERRRGTCERCVANQGFQFCPHCGGHLNPRRRDQDRCRSCTTPFQPNNGYRYPDCKDRVLLTSR